MKLRWMGAATALALLAGCGDTAADAPKGEMTANEVAAEMSSIELEPGQWEMTQEIVEASAPGMPEAALAQMRGQKTTVQSCITPEQAKKPDADFFAGQQNQGCKYEDFSMAGGKVRGKVTCTGGDMPGTMTMAMAGTYGASAYDMTMDMQMVPTAGADAPGAMTFKSHTTGRRIGQCPAGGQG